jgi:hypothetical protein
VKAGGGKDIFFLCKKAGNMITKIQFDEIKLKFGDCASWAIYADQGVNPKDNVGDISLLDPEKNPGLLEDLNPNYVLVGLNISGRIKRPLANFHSSDSMSQDYKIRDGIKDTPFWGAYMTDIIKDFEQKCSGKMMQYLRCNKEFESENIQLFLEEISILGAHKPKIIAFGKDAYSILKRNLPDFDIYKVPHYSAYLRKGALRQSFIDLGIF